MHSNVNSMAATLFSHIESTGTGCADILPVVFTTGTCVENWFHTESVPRDNLPLYYSTTLQFELSFVIFKA